MKMVEMTKEEKAFVEKLRKKFPEKEVKIVFHKGKCGLENMTFPFWEIYAVDSKGNEVSEMFNDVITYRRNFGDTRFHEDSSHYDQAYKYLEGLN